MFFFGVGAYDFTADSSSVVAKLAKLLSKWRITVGTLLSVYFKVHVLSIVNCAVFFRLIRLSALLSLSELKENRI